VRIRPLYFVFDGDCIEFDNDSTRSQWDPIFGEPVSDNVGLGGLRYPPGAPWSIQWNESDRASAVMGGAWPGRSVVDGE